MSLLDGEIAGLFGDVFGAFYLDGVLVRTTLTGDGAGGGSASDDAGQPCKLQIDSCSDRQQRQDGYTEKDVSIIVLQSGIVGGDINPNVKITPASGPYAGMTFQARTPVDRDPANSYWQFRATPV